MIESLYLQIIVAGFAGGVVRGLVGFVKHQYSYKNVEFNLSYFISMMFISGVVGLITAIAVEGIGLDFLGLGYITPSMAIIIGYAGGDLIENVYKIILRKPSLYSFPELLKK